MKFWQLYYSFEFLTICIFFLNYLEDFVIFLYLLSFCKIIYYYFAYKNEIEDKFQYEVFFNFFGLNNILLSIIFIILDFIKISLTFQIIINFFFLGIYICGLLAECGARKGNY